MTTTGASEIGAKALLFLAEDEDRLVRFLAETGLDPSDLRQQAGTDMMLGAVLGHLLEDESLLLVFTTSNGLEPTDVQSAWRALGGAPTWDSV